MGIIGKIESINEKGLDGDHFSLNLYPTHNKPYVVGSTQGCDVPIPVISNVAHEQAHIFIDENNKVFLANISETGILKVNGVPILKEKKRLIGHEDVMEIFDQKLRFVYANHQTENTQEKMKRRSMGSLVYKSLKQSPKRRKSMSSSLQKVKKPLGNKTNLPQSPKRRKSLGNAKKQLRQTPKSSAKKKSTPRSNKRKSKTPSHNSDIREQSGKKERQKSLNTPIRRSIKAIGRKRLSVGKPSPRLAYLASPKNPRQKIPYTPKDSTKKSPGKKRK